MPKQRKFKRLNDKEQMLFLVRYLSDAMYEHPSVCGKDYVSKHRTDVVGIALQYGGNLKMRREDYDKIKNLTVGEIIDVFNENYKK